MLLCDIINDDCRKNAIWERHQVSDRNKIDADLVNVVWEYGSAKRFIAIKLVAVCALLNSTKSELMLAATHVDLW